MTVSAGNVLQKIIFPLLPFSRTKNSKWADFNHSPGWNLIIWNFWSQGNGWNLLIWNFWSWKMGGAGILFSGGYDISSGNGHKHKLELKLQSRPRAKRRLLIAHSRVPKKVACSKYKLRKNRSFSRTIKSRHPVHLFSSFLVFFKKTTSPSLFCTWGPISTSGISEKIQKNTIKRGKRIYWQENGKTHPLVNCVCPHTNPSRKRREASTSELCMSHTTHPELHLLSEWHLQFCECLPWIK